MIFLKIIVAITGASGIQYGIRLLEVFANKKDIETYLVVSNAGKEIMRIETDYELNDLKNLCDKFFDENNLEASIASGSFLTEGMVIVPASQKTIGAIANGYADNLVVRAADVCLKEDRKLVIVPRETPLNSIHLENMTKLSKMGATILPASPGFYHNPKSVMDVVDHVVGKIMDTLEVEHEIFDRWKGRENKEKGKEIEVKVPVDLQEAQRKIKEKGGKFRKKVNQKDLYFKTSDEEREILRVRKTDGKTILGYKGIEKSDNSVFNELEVEVIDSDKMIDILDNLGFEEKVEIQKDRWYYDLDGVTLELNDIEDLGSYLDFEVISDDEDKAKEKIYGAMNELDYSKDDIEPRLYYELLEEK